MLDDEDQEFFADLDVQEDNNIGHVNNNQDKSDGTACNFIKKETLAQVFSCEFCENFKNTFFTEHLWETAFGKLFKFC